jgi:hypothetical protein
MTTNHVITYSLFAFAGASWGITTVEFLIFLIKDKTGDSYLDKEIEVVIARKAMVSVIITAVCFAILYFIKWRFR